MMLNGYIVRFLPQTNVTIRIRIGNKYDIDIIPFNRCEYKRPPTGRIYYYLKNHFFNIFIRDEPNFNEIYNVKVDNIIDSRKLLKLLESTRRGEDSRLNDVIKILKSYD